MSSMEMQSAVNQMRALASQAAGDHHRTGGAGATVGEGGFADELHASLQHINALQQTAGDEAKAFQAGQPGVELYDVMIDSQKAGLAFQMGVQMRNRLVNAYKEVMNMQV